MVELRFFAAAREAVGASTVTVGSGTLASILEAFDSPVISRCSVLVNGVVTSDPSALISDGDQVDLLPPFAGG